MSVEVTQSVGGSVAKYRRVSVKVSQSVVKGRWGCRGVLVGVSRNVVRECGVRESRAVSYNVQARGLGAITFYLQRPFKVVLRRILSLPQPQRPTLNPCELSVPFGVPCGLWGHWDRLVKACHVLLKAQTFLKVFSL